MLCTINLHDPDMDCNERITHNLIMRESTFAIIHYVGKGNKSEITDYLK